MKKYLMIEVEEITDAQKDGGNIEVLFEGEIVRAFYAGELWWYKSGKTVHTIAPAPTHYLPNGLPSPDQAVEVFESEVCYQPELDHPENSKVFLKVADFDNETKVGVFKLPEVQS